MVKNRVLHSQINSQAAAEVQPIDCEQTNRTRHSKSYYRSHSDHFICHNLWPPKLLSGRCSGGSSMLERSEKIWEARLLCREKRLKIKNKFLIVSVRLIEFPALRLLIFAHFSFLFLSTRPPKRCAPRSHLGSLSRHSITDGRFFWLTLF